MVRNTFVGKPKSKVWVPKKSQRTWPVSKILLATIINLPRNVPAQHKDPGGKEDREPVESTMFMENLRI